MKSVTAPSFSKYTFIEQYLLPCRPNALDTRFSSTQFLLRSLSAVASGEIGRGIHLRIQVLATHISLPGCLPTLPLLQISLSNHIQPAIQQAANPQSALYKYRLVQALFRSFREILR